MIGAGAPAGEDRFPTLDGLRGLAVMGILLMNIVAFALPEGAYFNPLAAGTRGWADWAAWGSAMLLVDGKMRALFSMLFGASMLLVIRRADETDGNGLTVHLRRMAALLPFGLVHNYMIWWGDILAHYAVIGTVACIFAYHDTRALVRIAILCFAVQLLIAGSVVLTLATIQDAAAAPGASPADVATWLDIRALIGVATPDRLAADIALWRGPYAGILRELSVDRFGDQFLLLWSGGAETLGLMLLGMAGLRSGFLTGSWTRARYARAARWGYGVGLPAMALLLAVEVRSGFDSLTVFAVAGWASGPVRPILALAHAALAMLWLTGGAAAGLRGRVIAAGRMAFSNYLGTSLAMTCLFYGWGLGLFARLDRAELLLVVALAWAVMLAWSKPWLARHPHGPLEWLWRSLARGAVQRWRRTDAHR